MDSKNEYQPICATLFGALSLQADGHDFTALLTRSKKMSGLLSYFLIHAGRSIAVGELLDAIWPESDNGRPENALKMQIYRLRALLEQAGIPYFKECIIAERGSYRWNADITCVVDAIEFDKCCTSAFDQMTAESERIELLKQAITLYQGEFIPICAAQSWVAPLDAYYRLRYRQVVSSLVALLEQQNAFSAVADLCRRAILIDPLEEGPHYSLMLALFHQSRDKEALEHYQYIHKLFAEKLGAPPSDRIEVLRQRIHRAAQQTALNLTTIKQDLQESSIAAGALVCDYQLFRQIYRLQARISSRNGITMSIALLTLVPIVENTNNKTAMKTSMSRLLTIAQACLRNTDTIAPYSASQHLVILPSSSLQSAKTAVLRVVSRYKYQYPQSLFTVHYTLEPIEPAFSLGIPDPEI